MRACVSMRVTARERATTSRSIYLSIRARKEEEIERARQRRAEEERKRRSEGGRKIDGRRRGLGKHHNRASFEVTDVAGQEGVRVRVSRGVRL